MAITEAQILEYVRSAFSLGATIPADIQTDIDLALKTCLRDLSSLDLLVKSTDGTDEITDSTVTIDVTESELPQFKAVKTLTLTDSNSVALEPLILMEGGIEGYREGVSISDSRGEPIYYAIDQRLIYPFRPPDQTYTYLLEYYANHLFPGAGEDITIEFTDDFLLAVSFGTCYWLGRIKNSFRKYVENWGPVYFDERQRMRGLI